MGYHAKILLKYPIEERRFMKSQKNDVAAGQEVNLAYYQIVSVFKEKSKRSVHLVFFYGIEFFFEIV